MFSVWKGGCFWKFTLSYRRGKWAGSHLMRLIAVAPSYANKTHLTWVTKPMWMWMNECGTLETSSVSASQIDVTCHLFLSIYRKHVGTLPFQLIVVPGSGVSWRNHQSSSSLGKRGRQGGTEARHVQEPPQGVGWGVRERKGVKGRSIMAWRWSRTELIVIRIWSNVLIQN